MCRYARTCVDARRVRAFLFACFFPPSSSHSNFLDEGQPLPPSVVVSISYSNQNFGLKFRFQTRLTVLYAVKKKNWGPNIDITLWPLSPPHYNHRGVVAGFSCSSRNFGLKFRFQTRLTVLYAEEKYRAKNIDINFLTPQPLSPFLTIGVKKIDVNVCAPILFLCIKNC